MAAKRGCLEMVSDMLKYLRSSLFVAVVASGGLATPVMAQSTSELAVRVTQMEDQMRQLVGQVEELTFQVKQLRVRGEGETGAMEQPSAKTTRLATESATEAQNNTASDKEVEQVEDQPLAQASEEQTYMKTIVSEDGAASQEVIKQAPGPKILGSLSTSAAAEDGGFQGKVLVAPAQQESGTDSSMIQGVTTQSSNAIETVSLSPDSPEALYERSNESLLRRQFGDAEAGFSTFIEKFPDHSLAGSAQYWLGETYYAQSDFRQAAQAFLRGYKQYPKSRRAADSLLKLGISLDRLGQKQQACASYDAVSSEYPKAVEARKRAQAEAKRAGCSA
ncbi:MAG TPA: tol-pal system protein YbgF [Aestuariivirga sp.]|nr:tol-pal system protein YbgF [Aestuariivirga sp.]